MDRFPCTCLLSTLWPSAAILYCYSRACLISHPGLMLDTHKHSLLKAKTFHGFLLPRVLLLSYNVKWNVCFNLWKEQLTSWLRFYWKCIPWRARIQIHGAFSVLLNTPTVQGAFTVIYAAATAAKSLQSCPTLCDPIDGSSPGSSVPEILQARVLEWGAIAFSGYIC